MKKGTLLIPSGVKNGQEAKHLFAILTDACPENCHLLVSLTTLHPGQPHDPACVVEPGEHRFVDRQSYALYRLAQIQAGDRLIKMVEGWLYSQHDALTDELLDKMVAGIAMSRFVPRYIKKYLGI